MTAAERLRALNQGQVPSNPATPAVPVYNPSPCSLGPTPAPTKEAYRLNMGDLVDKVCGYIGIEADNTATNAVKVRWNSGLKDGVAGSKELIQALYGIPSSPSTWASENTAVLFGTSKTGAIFAGNVFVPYMNDIYETTPYVFGAVTFQRQGGTDAAFAEFKRNAFQVYALNPGGNFSTSNYDLKPEICSPCFNSGDDVVQWNSSGMPAASTEGFSIILPAGLKGQFEFCVIGSAQQRLIEPCGQ